MPDGYMPCGNIQDKAGDQKRTKPRGSVSCKEFLQLVAEVDHTSNTRTPNHPNAVYIHGIAIDLCIGNCLVGCNNGCLGEGIHLAGILLIHELSRIEVLKLACEAGL